MSAFFATSRRCALAIVIAFVALAPALRAAERIPPAPKRYVTDETRTISVTTVNRLTAQLEQLERESSNQILVAMYPRMESDSSVEDYTVRVAQSWGVGQKGRNNGAVLFVFKADRQIYLQVGYGLEGVLPDATAHDIIENILKPRFRAGDFDGGLTAAVDAVIAATRGEYKGSGRTRAEGRSGAPAGPISFGFLMMVLVLISVIARLVRRGSGPVLLGGPRMYRRRPTVWWGGPGGGGSGGGWSGGGFSGGGGSFGGGGAGGKW